MSWESAQKSEIASWLCDNEEEKDRKAEREFIRYPRLIKEMGINLIDTKNKVCLDIGCGPRGVLYNIESNYKVGLDPLIDDYAEHFDMSFLDKKIKAVGEKIPETNNSFDLVTAVNSLDHCKHPREVIEEIKRVLVPSGYLAVHFCINLAQNHPHPSHRLNISPESFHYLIDSDFETVHEVKFPELRYGWVKYRGECGQPALAGLYRLTTKGG